jgi:Pentapeptide repeats (8 copies)
MTITTGFKATNENMQCRGVQFVIGEWQEAEGDLKKCVNGFHFCTELAHTFYYYDKITDRRFSCEVEDVLEVPCEPGVKDKRVARRIRLIEEITSAGNKDTGNGNTGEWNTGYRNTGKENTGDGNTGNGNTGDWNTGYRNTGKENTGEGNTGNGNTGNRNTGNGNTGDWNIGNDNTGDENTGDRNTGDSNIGNRNTGDGNTGNRNTGNWNIGYWNTGNRNTGDWNIGYRNTGDRNTGDYNYCNRSAGFFNSTEPNVIIFDLPCDFKYQEFQEKYSVLCSTLADKLLKTEEIDVLEFSDLPNITQDKLDNLHRKIINS